MRNAGLEEAQAGIKIARRNINNLKYADDTTLMAESEEDLKSLLKKVKEETEKVGLKLNIQKNWCFWTVVLEKTLESPLDCKEIQSVNPKGDQSWLFIGRIDVEAETPILWPPHAKSWIIGKDPDSGRDWGQEEKGMIEDEMAGWHHWLDGREFE